MIINSGSCSTSKGYLNGYMEWTFHVIYSGKIMYFGMKTTYFKLQIQGFPTGMVKLLELFVSISLSNRNINTYVIKLFYQQDTALKMPEKLLVYNRSSIIVKKNYLFGPSKRLYPLGKPWLPLPRLA